MVTCCEGVEVDAVERSRFARTRAPQVSTKLGKVRGLLAVDHPARETCFASAETRYLRRPLEDDHLIGKVLQYLHPCGDSLGGFSALVGLHRRVVRQHGDVTR